MSSCFRKIRKGVAGATEFIGCGMLLGMAALVFFQVIMRKIFNSPMAWTEELVRILLVWTTFLGSFVALYNKQHLLMSVFVEKLGSCRKDALLLFTNSVMMLLLLIIVFYGIEYIEQMGMIPMPVTGLKNFYVYGVMWISFLLMFTETIFVEIEVVNSLRLGIRMGERK